MKTHVIKEGEIYRDEHVTVTAIRTKHVSGGAYPSYAFMVEGEGKTFLVRIGVQIPKASKHHCLARALNANCRNYFHRPISIISVHSASFRFAPLSPRFTGILHQWSQ